MFEGLSERLGQVFARLRGRGVLTAADIDEAMREVRLALLEADVNFKVVKDFVGRVKERAYGQEVLKSLTPGQQVVKVVHEELVRLMGEGGSSRIAVSPKPPTVVMFVGLQGSGKTTHVAKLGFYLKKQGRNPLLVAADTYRPAAAEQLRTLGQRVDLPVFHQSGLSAVQMAEAGVKEAVRLGRDLVLIDTAGRLQIDEALMQELEDMKARTKPHEILLVVDAMTGQEAVAVAEGFHQRLGIDGVILTKLDGDTRGGAALSVRAVTGRPIKFVGTGERPEGLEPFYPERMASRILGMGDVLTLIERAQEVVDAEKARDLEKKLRTQGFTLEDFLDQMQQMRKLGPLDQLLGMMPGMGSLKQLKNVQVDEKELAHIEAIIRSMTPSERRHPEMIDGSRRKRIARGSGTKVQDVNRLLKQFDDIRRLMKSFGRSGGPGKRGKGARGFGLPKLPF